MNLAFGRAARDEPTQTTLTANPDGPQKDRAEGEPVTSRRPRLRRTRRPSGCAAKVHQPRTGRALTVH